MNKAHTLQKLNLSPTEQFYEPPRVLNTPIHNTYQDRFALNYALWPGHQLSAHATGTAAATFAAVAATFAAITVSLRAGPRQHLAVGAVNAISKPSTLGCSCSVGKKGVVAKVNERHRRRWLVRPTQQESAACGVGKTPSHRSQVDLTNHSKCNQNTSEGSI